MSTENEDLEIKAMGAISSALSPLEPEQQSRVLRWAADRYSVRDIKTGVASTSHFEDTSPPSSVGVPIRSYTSIDEIFETGVAKTNAHKALLAAYWFQVVQGNPTFQSFTLNVALKNMGQGIPNITDALGSAEAQKPALIMQTAKTGKSRQARKTYKLTTAGVKAVEAMLAGSDVD
ncbi:hypothetical protein [Microbacterium murale]|uniref:Uncharacterized protein n=1 Tax=Microbacterium murale TaxID=1081040 RepID=A0ABU0P8T9_9MICO|nr:hypothetical protein [Microbacterium murale]MDQ0643759.1 hypothetical protein [Microbacterium murale]